MTITFTTETGSVYHLDSEKMRWERVHTAEQSGNIRDEGGKLIEWPAIKVNYSVVLLVEPHESTPDGMIRMIRTSHVKSIVLGID